MHKNIPLKNPVNPKILQILVLLLFTVQSLAQDCSFKEPFFTMDFGSGKNIPGSDFTPFPNYKRVYSSCPLDGYYSFVSYTSECFANDWFTLEDHTPNDKDGNMLLVNASESGGIFFTSVINGVKPNTTYQFAAWMLNVCRIGGGCSPLPPNIAITLLTPAGEKVALFQTGLLPQTDEPHWKNYSGTFTTPKNVTTLFLTMDDITIGGCGNDFALDDITLRECIKPEPIVKPEVKPDAKPVTKPVIPVIKPIAKKIPAKSDPVKKDIAVTPVQKQVIDSPKTFAPVTKQKLLLPVPIPISTRANPVIKQIETGAGELVIDLYDNGEIDGDTVTVYHNNELIVSRAALSTKPVSFRIKVDKAQPHHELVMVANNLGSIPPNTSLMIITANGKRYQVFISSSEQKNAKIVIDLKE